MNGIVQDKPAVNQWWSLTRTTVLYSPVPKLSEDVLSAAEEEETWIKQNRYYQSELLWLLSLEHHRFWSQVVFSPGTMDGLISFLQEALPYYALSEYLVNSQIEKNYHETARLVFQVFARLGSFDTEAHHYLPAEKQAELIYNNYIFTMPILLDLCHIYGRENRCTISKIVENLFRKQPRFQSDLSQVISFVSEMFKILNYSFCGATSMNSQSSDPKPLSLSSDNISLKDMTADQFHDRLLFLLDTVATVAAFLDVYTPACSECRGRNLHQQLAVFYNEAVPEIEKKIESFGATEDNVPFYVDVKHKLNLAKIEMLRLFKVVSTSLVSLLLEKRDDLSEEDLKGYVDEYLTMLTDCLAEHIFIRDYHNVHGIDGDLDAIAQVSPELDTIKYNYLMESVISAFPSCQSQKTTASCFKLNSGVATHRNNVTSCQETNEPSTSGLSNTEVKTKPSGVELDSLITEVKDILPDLGDGFVLRCLDYFDYHSDAVINAILEDSLPSQLKNMDRNIPCPHEEKDENTPQRLNVFDNDEFDIMTKDHIDTSKIHKGKRRTVPKNAFDLLNDKSALVGLKDMYHRFGSIDTTGSLYDDEYDDTYDDGVAIDEAGADDERRHFVVPRVLRTKEEVSDAEESDKEEELDRAAPRDAFCQNPAEVRARYERQRGGATVKHKEASERKTPNVVGKPKGQGQDKQVVINRDRKNVNKSSRGNHNRRSGAQHKRNQGMIPS